MLNVQVLKKDFKEQHEGLILIKNEKLNPTSQRFK